MPPRRKLLAALLGTGLSAGLPAAPPVWAAAAITVSDAWARATIPGMDQGVVYLSLRAEGQADALLRASTPVAREASLHVSRMTAGGVMTMRSVASLALPAGKTVALAPDGYHIMLIGLAKPLLAGGDFPLTLYFSHAAPMTVTVTVRPLGAAAPMSAMPGMK
ncbi:MAG: copper chaperone PCu(A)C [Rhodospirillales bacterium]|nr:copper chaperone PCu(A)C [Rhodospirillales bacterium]